MYSPASAPVSHDQCSVMITVTEDGWLALIETPLLILEFSTALFNANVVPTAKLNMCHSIKVLYIKVNKLLTIQLKVMHGTIN